MGNASGRHRSTRAIDEKCARRGNMMMLIAVLLVTLMSIAIVAIDLGYICVVRTGLERTAACAALAGADALLKPIDSVELSEVAPPFRLEDSRRAARTYGARKGAGRYLQTRSGKRLYVDLNARNRTVGKIELGRLSGSRFMPDESNPSAVQVRCRLAGQNSHSSLQQLVTDVFGFSTTRASAIATVVDYPVVMPMATSVAHFESQSGPDQFSFRNGKVFQSGDGVPEIVIYPAPWDGTGVPPGHLGALQIGPRSSARVMRRQIDRGPSLEDFEYHGGTLSSGVRLKGKTTVDPEIQTACGGGKADGHTYQGVIGRPRVMPLYAHVTGTGDDATFTVVRFVAVRILDVQLDSVPGQITVQPIGSKEKLKPSIRLAR